MRKALILCALALAGCGSGVMARAPMVILDADLGDDVDDAYAVAWALRSPRLDVRAVVTAYGDTALRARMARRMLAMLGRRDVAVGQGVKTPPGTVFTQKSWAEGGPAGSSPDGVALALDIVRRHPGQVTLVALAPLTNIAAMIARDPETFAKLHEVVLMGGSIRRGYDRPDGSANPVPEAEYNIARDPQGLRALLASGVPVRMIPLDSTQVRPGPATLASIYARVPMLKELTAEWRRLNPWHQTRPTLFDAATVAAAIDPALCPATPLRIGVDDKGFTRVETGLPNVTACLSSDGAAIVARMTADLTQK